MLAIVTRLAAPAAAALALSACATTPPPMPAPRVSTAFTLKTDQPRTAEQLAVRFDRADLSFRVSPEARALSAVAVLNFTATAPLDRLAVELDTLFDISEIAVDGVPVSPDRWANPDGRLTVDLPRPLAAGQAVELRIAYAGQPRVAPNPPWGGGFVWSTTPDGRPWIATAVQGEGCDLFWPCIDHPLAEPKRVDMHITVPTGLSAPANGRLTGVVDQGDGWTTWNWRAAQPNTYAVALNIGPYVELSADYASRYGNTVPMTYWYLPTDAPDRARALFDEFPRMLDFYEATIGPFPFGDEKMGVVETPHLGMEHQTINAYGNGYKLDGRGFDWLLQHELSHEWFGNQLTNVNADDMWLHEGLGTYMQPLYDRWLHGDRAMQASLLKQRQDLLNRYPVVSGERRTEDQVYDGDKGPGLDLYNKGSLIAHSLRLLIGDEAFFNAVRRLVYGRPDPRPGNFSPRFASTDDFLALVNDESGLNLTWFFRAYLYQAALPDLRQTRDGDRLTLAWVTGDGGTFPMPLDVEIDGTVTTLPMTGNRGEITVPTGAHVLIDPANKVLRRLEHIEVWKAREAADAGR
ncbi:M1 family metallopeptidase [Brevundimonas sp.]|uniref:M1 family metallopeptidase n=1 Tax=Brevundimonas sp. TaxID=1871086 RepID=UPI003A8D7DEA